MKKKATPVRVTLSPQDKTRVELAHKIGEMLEGISNEDVLLILSTLIGSCISRAEKTHVPAITKRVITDITDAATFFRELNEVSGSQGMRQ